MTPSGDISMPSIVSYLFEDGKLLGKLPNLRLRETYSIFSAKTFIGVCEHGLYEFGRRKYFVYKAKLVNKA